MSARGEPFLPVSSAFFPALIDSLLDAVVTIDAEGRIKACNAAAARLFGHAPDEVLGEPIGRLVAAPFRSGRVEGRRRDGSAFPCELTVTEFEADGGRFYAGIVRPLDERERTLVARGEARLRNIIDSLAALVAVYSTDGVMLDVNQPALDAGGVARADAIGQRIDRTPWVSHAPETAARALAMVHEAAAGRVVRGELDIRVADGSQRYLDVILGPLRDPSGAIVEVLTSGIDITERRRAEQEVQRRLRQQEAVARLGALAL
jgi:PAS domain S-box-containing protein